MPVNYTNPFNNVYPQNAGYRAQPPMSPQGNLIWVSGIEGAKAWNVAPGQSVPLFDSEAQCFYVKSADANGFPQPLRIFDYTERAQAEVAPEEPNTPQIDTSLFVQKSDFEALRDMMLDLSSDISYLKDKLDRKSQQYQKKKGEAHE